MAGDDAKSVSPEVETTGQDPSEQQSARVSPPPESGKGKGKATSQPESPAEGQKNSASSSSAEAEPEAKSAVANTQSWQAIFAPQYNAYYFYNIQTGETTWTNPLQPSDSTVSDAPPPTTTTSSDPATFVESESEQPSASQLTALQAAALAQGIDPSLAHLDPALLTATTSASGGPIPAFQAKFNARTGAFTRPDARTPGHLSEYERMKRMSEFYFDVNAWEQQLAQDDAEEEEGNGKKRKRPTKKDLVRFPLVDVKLTLIRN